MQRGKKRVPSIVLAVLLILTSMNVLWVSAASSFVAPGGWYLISDTKKDIAPGIVENEVIINKSAGDNQVMGYAVTVDMAPGAKTTLLAGYTNYSGATWAMQTVRDQATKAEAARGLNIVAAVNGDFFNMSTGEPTGTLVLNGEVCKSGIGKAYFAILKDGTAKIGYSMTADLLPDVQEALGGSGVLVKDGARTSYGTGDYSLAPRTAVGIKADGSVVVYVADGRNYPISCGLTLGEVADIMKGFGCVDVLNLDGGGSTTYLAEHEGSGRLEVKNNPSDGVERKVSSTLFVVSTALPTGVFDHAAVSPNNDVYTPGSTVQFTAVGVDSAGGEAALPANGTFALEDEAFGTIASDGTFVSSGKCGTVKVNYTVDGVVCGSTTVDVQHPDRIFFSDEEVSLGFSDESNLGLNVKYKDRDVIYKDGDFLWTAANDPLSVNGKFEMGDKKVILNGGDNALHFFTTAVVGGQNTVVLGAALTPQEQEAFYAQLMGTFAGNKFISSPGNSVTGTISVKYAENQEVSSSVKAIIGRLPKVVQDFESTDIEFGRVAFNANGGVQRWESSNSATANMLTGHYLNGDGSSRGGYESAEVVDVDSGEPVRFGNQSLKLNYDFRNTNGIEGACVGFTEAGTVIEGSPTGIGMWVYVPEGTPNFWLRIRLLDGSNNILTLDYTAQKEGINWFGWKYVECSLTGKQGPFKLLAGETIRLMHTYSAYDAMGDWLAGTMTTAGVSGSPNRVKLDRSTCVGSIYVDNLQFVYGANVDDIDNPVVDTITANNEVLENGSVVTDSTVDFQANFHDVKNKYTSGIDYDVVRIYVDGVNRTYDEDCVLTSGDDRINLYGLKLADGDHTVTVLLRDKFGNETTQTKAFTVDTDGSSELTGMVVGEKSSPLLGQSFPLYLSTNGIEKIQSVSAKLSAGSDYSDYTVDFTQGFTGTTSVDSKTGELTISAERNSDELPEDVDYVAKVNYAIPASLTLGAQFTYSVSSLTFTLINQDANEKLANSFACGTKRIDVSAAYKVSADPMVVGMSGRVYVNNADGSPAGGVNVYYANGNLLGTTNRSGFFTTNALCSQLAPFSIYASGEKGISFKFNSQSVNPACNNDGTPTYTMMNASPESETQKNITWLSDPSATESVPVVELAKKADFDENGKSALKRITGTSAIRQLMGSADISANLAVRLNTVNLKNLEPDTAYVYRVGDGSVFGEFNTFNTTHDGVATKFFVIGDTQADDMTNINNIVDSIANSGESYSFGVQTGDFVEKPTMYLDWSNILGAFSNSYLGSVDMVHVIGNHEQFGDDMDDLFAAALFNTESPTHYSVEYGNVYVAVLNYTGNRSQLQEEMDWLVEDAEKSDCQWKVVVCHQPPYGTNAAATDCKDFNELVPAACEAADIDVVFAGHDHAFARTFPMTAGSVDEENGVVYYVCGSTGEKSYTATNNPAYNFDVVNQDYNAIYLTVDATDEYLRIVAHESDGSAIDTYTRLSDEACVEAGHKYSFGEDGYLTCDECGYSTKPGDYTGFATDEATGRAMYFIGGAVKTGWFTISNDCYYFDENGLAVTGEQTIDGIDYLFNEDGTQNGGAFVTVDGITRCYRGGTYLKGWHEINGYTYYFHTKDGSMATGEDTVTVRTGQRLNCVFSDNGKLLRGAFYTTDEGTKYYWGGDLASGWTVIDNQKYYFDPITNIMAVDTVEIDGQVLAFTMEGVFVHEGAHQWREGIILGDSNCELLTFTSYSCEICESTKTIEEGPKAHTDEDGNGICDECNALIAASNAFFRFAKKLINLWAEVLKRLLSIFR